MPTEAGSINAPERRRQFRSSQTPNQTSVNKSRPARINFRDVACADVSHFMRENDKTGGVTDADGVGERAIGNSNCGPRKYHALISVNKFPPPQTPWAIFSNIAYVDASHLLRRNDVSRPNGTPYEMFRYLRGGSSAMDVTRGFRGIRKRRTPLREAHFLYERPLPCSNTHPVGVCVGCRYGGWKAIRSLQ